MSIVGIKSFLKTQLSELGLKEWNDVFAFNNIPSNIIDSSYHILFGDLTGESISGQDVVVNQSVEIRFFYKGFRKVEEAETKARTKSEEIIAALCFKGNHTQTIKGVYFDNFSCEPINSENNDNVVVGVVSLTIRTHICLV